ncbi:MAG TPA: ATP-binding protein [Sporichthya sp.]|nr:ATP-binding protein [Sporichthya sp.]
MSVRTIRPRTLRAGLRLVLLLLLLVLLGVAGSVAGEFARVDHDVDTLVDKVSPARISAESLSAAYLDQETGVRGYVLSRDRAALRPYVQGRLDAANESAEIRRLLGSSPRVTADLDAIEAAGERWRADYASVAVAEVQATPADQKLKKLPEKLGQARFNAVRAHFEELNASLTAERGQARQRVVDETTRIRTIAGGALVAAILGGLALWMALRRLVLGPLDRLGSETRVVAGGEFGRPVTVDGPVEVRRLGGDVEAMRRQLAESLLEARRAETEARLAEEEVRAQAAMLEAQTEDLRRSNEELEQFAYVASHDLQEPLRKVASFCQMLQRRYEGQLDERADQYIEFAVDGAKRMQQLINDLLAFSRVGRTTEQLVPVDTALAAQRALDALGTAVEEAHAEVEIGALPTVPGDEALLTQVFQNLIGNALKFRAPDRPARVSITAVQEDEFWHFRCADNGIGIDPQYADRIFIIFQRLHSKDLYGGTGIGLSLCKKIVEYHGGRIWLDTERNGAPGSVVHWTLPVSPAPLSPAALVGSEGKV